MDTHVLQRLCYKSRVQQQSYASDASYYNTGLSLGCVSPFWLKGSIIKELPLICFLLLSLFGYCFTVHSSHSHWQSVLSQSMRNVCQRPSVMNNQLPSARKHLTSQHSINLHLKSPSGERKAGSSACSNHCTFTPGQARYCSHYNY